MDGGSARTVTTATSQQDLFDVTATDRLLVESEHARGIHTGAQLRERDPRRHELISRLLRCGSLTQREVAWYVGTSCGLVGAMAAEMGLVGVEESKKRRARGWRTVEALAQAVAVESLAEALTNPEVRRRRSLSELAILGGTAHDKAALDEGEATARVELTQHSRHDEYLQMLVADVRLEEAAPEAAEARTDSVSAVSSAISEDIEARISGMDKSSGQSNGASGLVGVGSGDAAPAAAGARRGEAGDGDAQPGGVMAARA